ncbi:hypothetical protein AOLI_G00152830 [Acnodon oligacanthus]
MTSAAVVAMAPTGPGNLFSVSISISFGGKRRGLKLQDRARCLWRRQIKEQELYSTGSYTARRPLVSADHSAKARQVSFKPSSPELGSVAVATAACSPSSDRLNESQQADFSLDAGSSRDAVSGAEETESEAELMTDEMDLKLQSSVNSSAKLSSGRRHIEEMENVRSHLQTMLRSVPTATDTDELLRPASQHLQDDSIRE